jgi:hypothetical protein
MSAAGGEDHAAVWRQRGDATGSVGHREKQVSPEPCTALMRPCAPSIAAPCIRRCPLRSFPYTKSAFSRWSVELADRCGSIALLRLVPCMACICVHVVSMLQG